MINKAEYMRRQREKIPVKVNKFSFKINGNQLAKLGKILRLGLLKINIRALNKETPLVFVVYAPDEKIKEEKREENRKRLKETEVLFKPYWMIYPKAGRENYKAALEAFDTTQNDIPDLIAFCGICLHFHRTEWKNGNVPSMAEFLNRKEWTNCNSSIYEQIEYERESVKEFAEKRIKKYFREEL